MSYIQNLTTTIMSLINSGKQRLILVGKPFIEGYYGSNRERVNIQKNLNMSRKDLFLSEWNTQKLKHETYFNYRELIGGNLNYAYFDTNVPQWMKTWKKLPVIDSFDDLRRNFVDTFVHINKIFICDQIEKLRKNVNSAALGDIRQQYGSESDFDELTNEDADLYYATVPYYEHWNGDVQESELNLFNKTNTQNNEYYMTKEDIKQNPDIITPLKQESIESVPNRQDFYVEDYRNIDAWDNNYEVYRDDTNFRYHNKIPIFQKSMQKRHYDRGNSEGLRGRGSLTNFTRKYDLSEIESGFVAYPPMAGFPDWK